MPKLLHNRRTKGTNSLMASAFSKEEVEKYFENENQWRLASKIHWGIVFSGIKSPEPYCKRYKITFYQFVYLTGQYKKFLNHKYVI